MIRTSFQFPQSSSPSWITSSRLPNRRWIIPLFFVWIVGYGVMTRSRARRLEGESYQATYGFQSIEGGGEGGAEEFFGSGEDMGDDSARRAAQSSSMKKPPPQSKMRYEKFQYHEGGGGIHHQQGGGGGHRHQGGGSDATKTTDATTATSSSSHTPSLRNPSYSSSSKMVAMASVPHSGEVKAEYSKPTKADTDTDTSSSKTDKKITYNRRKFVEYRSSDWETFWLENVERLETEQSICGVLYKDQKETLHQYLSALCTSTMPHPFEGWCVIDDENAPLWFRTANKEELEMTFERPKTIPDHVPIPEAVPVEPQPYQDTIFSRFVFYDEMKGEHYVEYIEPLVAHLRFPLAKCLEPQPISLEYAYHFMNFRGWIIPPPRSSFERMGYSAYFDAGAHGWHHQSGGPSLRPFITVWQRHGAHFQDIYALGSATDKKEFVSGVPKDYRDRVNYRQCELAASAKVHSKNHPFLPLYINETVTDRRTFVLVKLDVDKHLVEEKSIEYILAYDDDGGAKTDGAATGTDGEKDGGGGGDDEKDKDDEKDPMAQIHELVWEHDEGTNYLLNQFAARGSAMALPDFTLRKSYDYFLNLRKKGIRAHSWIYQHFLNT